MKTLLADAEGAELNARFELASPEAIVRWALEGGGLDRIAIASAFQAEGTCVMHMATRIRPGVPVLFLETGFHFAETLPVPGAGTRARRPAAGRVGGGTQHATPRQ